MINIIWYCKKCGYVNSDIYSYIPRLVKKGICPICKNKLNEIQENITYFQNHTEKAMPTWKDVVRHKYLKDVILDTEASNKRSNMEQKQQEELKNSSSTTEEKKYIPKCPICGSPNIKQIGTGERTLSVLTLGLLSNKINKSFKCNDCGGTF